MALQSIYVIAHSPVLPSYYLYTQITKRGKMKYSIEKIDFKGTGKKSLLITSGIHGNETNAVMNTMKLKKFIKANNNPWENMYSSITFLIGANEYGLRNDVRKTGREYDGSDLNRMFYNPKDCKTDIERLIEKNDIVVDVHNSPNISNCVLLTFDKYALEFKNFFVNNDLDVMVWNAQTPNIKNKANSYEHKIGFTIELNGMGDSSFENEKETFSFLKNVVEVVYKCQKKEGALNRDIIDKDIISTYEGIINWRDKHSKVFTKDSVIAEILDYEFNVIDAITAPYYCKLMVKTSSLFTREETTIGTIAKLGD